MLNVVCVRQGTKYGPEYVTKLHAMVARNLTLGTEGRFICFTDQPDELPGHIAVRPLPDGVAGWWCKLWLFSSGLFDEGDRILYFDLDTVIVGDLDAIARYDGEFAILRDFYRPNGLQSAVMAWGGGFGEHIWDSWVAAGRPEIEGGDQAWIEEWNGFAADRWQDLYPGLFCSYKVHCHPFPPEGSSVVVFHGEPRPDNCGTPWVDAMWSEGDTGHFQLAMVANVGLDQIRDQSRHSAARNLPRLTSKPSHGRGVVIVGGGPSLNDPLTIVEIQRHRAEGCAIWAINGTLQWLVSRHIWPDAMVMLDARESNADFLTYPAACGTIYLASQCYPTVYDRALKGRSKDRPVVRFDLDVMGDCGTTVGTHAILIAFVEGYRRIHLYGFDSSYRDGEGHAYAQGLNASERIVDAHIGDRVFKAAPWMVRQAQDFEGIARDVAAAGGEIVVHGDGLLPEMARILVNAPPTAADIRAGEILKRLTEPFPVGAEIGVFVGDTSAALLKHEGLALAMVDAWEGDGASYLGDSGDWHAGLSQTKQDEFCALARARVAFAGDRVNILRMRSSEAAQQIADASLDFVFIDADHCYEGCKSDIAAWLPKLKPGALLAGHDYENLGFPKFGVTQAVDEAARELNLTVDLGDNFTWFLRLPAAVEIAA